MASHRVNPFGDDDDLDDYGGAWGARPTPAETDDTTSDVSFSAAASDILKDTLRKEEVIK